MITHRYLPKPTRFSVIDDLSHARRAGIPLVEPGWTPPTTLLLMTDPGAATVVGWQRVVAAAGAQLTPTEQPGITRGLTPEEIAAARSVFGDTLDTSKITLTEGGPLSADGYARTLPGLVTFPAGTLSNPQPGFDNWLIHELTHAWQYQHGHDVGKLLFDAVRGDYDYGGARGLRDAWASGKPFTSFNFEAQARILRDYYLLKHTHRDTSAYDPYVRSVQVGAQDVLREPLPAPRGRPV